MSTPLHVRGVVLPDDVERDVYLVGDRLTFEPVPGAETIADRGFVVPGLVDVHCHIGIADGAVPVDDVAAARRLAHTDRDAGVLAIRDAGSPIDYAVLDDDPSVPRLVRAGRFLAPVRRYMPGLAIECTPEELPDRVTEQAKLATGWVKLVGDWIDRETGDLGPCFSPDVLARAVDAAHGAGARVAVHTFSEDAVSALVAAGVDSIEHGCGLSTDLIDRMVEQGTVLVPTMINVDWNFESIADRAEAKYPAYARHMRRLRRTFPDVVRAAHEAGVPLYAGSDAGGYIRHGQLDEEVILLHETGMAATDALAAGSWEARRWLGLPGLEEGGLADLVVYDADPRVDLGVLRAPRRIVLRGAVVR
ncbi:MAG: amidohydrolase family protein [Acidimicrobiales bacterium]